MADGLSNPAIALALFISVAAVKTHVSHILAKLGFGLPHAAGELGRGTRPRPACASPPVAARLPQDHSPESASWPIPSRPPARRIGTVTHADRRSGRHHDDHHW